MSKKMELRVLFSEDLKTWKATWSWPEDEQIQVQMDMVHTFLQIVTDHHDAKLEEYQKKLIEIRERFRK